MRELMKSSMTERSMKQSMWRASLGWRAKGDDLAAGGTGGVAGVAAVDEIRVEAGAVKVDDDVLAPAVVGDDCLFLAVG